MDKAKTKKVLNTILNVVLWLFVAFAAFTTVIAIAASSNADDVPQIGGKCLLSVESDSMYPTFKKYDLIISKTLSSDEKLQLEVGDVITFRADLNSDGTTELNTHRIVSVSGEGDSITFTTKGDNNDQSDGASVSLSAVVAKWTGTRIPLVGGMISFLQKPVGFLCVIVLPLALLFCYQIFVFVRTVLAVKNDGKRQITAADEEMIKQRAVEEYLRQQAEKNAQTAANGSTKEADGSAQQSEGDAALASAEPQPEEPCAQQPDDGENK